MKTTISGTFLKIVAVTLCSFYGGCGERPDQTSDPTKSWHAAIDPKALSGTWKMDQKSSKAALSEMGLGAIDSELILDEFGQCVCSNFPVSDFFRNPRFRIFSGKGSWLMRTNSNGLKHIQVDLEGSVMTFELSENRGTIRMFSVLYSEESPARLEFIRN